MVDGPRARLPPAGELREGRRPPTPAMFGLHICVKDTSHQMQPATLNCQVVAALAMRAIAARCAGERQGAMDELESLPLGSRALDVCSLRLETLTKDTVEDFAYRTWGLTRRAGAGRRQLRGAGVVALSRISWPRSGGGAGRC